MESYQVYTYNICILFSVSPTLEKLILWVKFLENFAVYNVTHSEHSRFRHVQELHHGSQSSFLTCGGGGSGGGMRGHGGSDGAYDARKRAC